MRIIIAVLAATAVALSACGSGETPDTTAVSAHVAQGDRRAVRPHPPRAATGSGRSALARARIGVHQRRDGREGPAGRRRLPAQGRRLR